MQYIQLISSNELPDISDLRPFKAVVIAEDTVTSDRQAAICQWLVESGCLYMMAWGQDCGSWDDAVNHANIEAFDSEEIPDDCVVITTRHEDESLKEAFWFSKYSAIHPCFRIENTVLLHLSPIGREQELGEKYMSA